MLPIFAFISSIIGPVTGFIDKLHVSESEKMELKNEMMKMQFEMQGKLIEYETKLMEGQASIVKAEAESSNKLTSSWRPIMMLVFTGLIVARWFGYSAVGISPELEMELFSIIKIGLGGYVGGRSLEKVAQVYFKAGKE